MAHYPSALVGLTIIIFLIGLSVYTLITIPYGEAIRLWRTNRREIYRQPSYAQPEWVNLFRRDDLPVTILLDSRAPATGGTVDKEIETVSEEMREIRLHFAFDYPYRGGFPQDLALHLTSRYREKRPLIVMELRTPDGRTIEFEPFSITSAHTYLASADDHLRQKNALGGVGGQPMHKLFAEPGDSPPLPVTGTYELRVSGFVFEEESDLDGELVVYGQVFGLAGTDHNRRDLTVALLWGAPIALAFGLGGAVLTSLLSMIISATGVWFGGWLDNLVQRLTEINMILPALPLAITIYLIYAKSIWAILGVMVLLSIFGTATKNYRAMFLQVKGAAYVEAARAQGASHGRIILHYLVPRIMPVLIPQLVILIPGYVFLEATLAYLGVSDAYLPTWGKVISDALSHIVFQGHYYWILEPVSLLLLTGMAFAMVGFSLDRILNPRLREK
jgi:peptide/nickel transport system permease protein